MFLFLVSGDNDVTPEVLGLLDSDLNNLQGDKSLTFQSHADRFIFIRFDQGTETGVRRFIITYRAVEREWQFKTILFDGYVCF